MRDCREATPVEVLERDLSTFFNGLPETDKAKVIEVFQCNKEREQEYLKRRYMYMQNQNEELKKENAILKEEIKLIVEGVMLKRHSELSNKVHDIICG